MFSDNVMLLDLIGLEAAFGGMPLPARVCQQARARTATNQWDFDIIIELSAGIISPAWMCCVIAAVCSNFLAAHCAALFN